MPQPTSLRSEIAQTVSRACTESAGTVQALAEEVGVSYAALCSWSRGRRQPPPHRLHRLADVLEDRAERLRVTAAELRERAGEPRPSRPRVVESPDGRPGILRTPVTPGLSIEPGSRGGATREPSRDGRPELARAAREAGEAREPLGAAPRSRPAALDALDALDAR